MSALVRPASIGCVLLLAAATGCAGDGEGTSEWGGSVSDSAGVRVVHNPARGSWNESEAWTVRETLSIGSLEGAEAEQFGQIVAIDVDEAGALYVLDGQASEVRVFDADGVHLRTFGEPGQGPGQLGRALAGVFIVAGEVLVPDLQNQRVNRYTPEGEAVGSYRIDMSEGVPIRWDGPIHGRLVAQKRVLAMSDTAASATGDPVVAIDRDGAVVDTLVMLPQGTSVNFSGGAPSFNFFAPEPIWDAGTDGRLLSGMNAEFRIEVRGTEGDVERVVTLPREPRRVTDRDRTVMLDAIRDLMGDQGVPPQALDMILGNATFADSYPLFASLITGPHGTIWAQQIRTGEELAGDRDGAFDPQDLGSTTWDVFDAEGRYLGEVEFPGRFQPMRVHGDRIYGVARDELDLQRVQVFDVVRPAE